MKRLKKALRKAYSRERSYGHIRKTCSLRDILHVIDNMSDSGEQLVVLYNAISDLADQEKAEKKFKEQSWVQVDEVNLIPKEKWVQIKKRLADRNDQSEEHY